MSDQIKRLVPNLGSLILIVVCLVGAIGTGIAVWVRLGAVAQGAVKNHESRDLDISHGAIRAHYVSKAELQKSINAIGSKVDSLAAEQRNITKQISAQWRELRDLRPRRRPRSSPRRDTDPD